MINVIEQAKHCLSVENNVPFSVYTSVREQVITNVPVIKPLLICVLDGCKEIGNQTKITCPSGTFVFLSNSTEVAMRNIPQGIEYFAVLIEFEFEEFDIFKLKSSHADPFFRGDISETLEQTLLQFLAWGSFAPQELWSIRRQELLLLLQHLGHHEVTAITESQHLSHQIHCMLSDDLHRELSSSELASDLAISESTLRRKLRAEGTSFQEIKDRVRLGRGLHLLQTTSSPIGLIAGECGYQSQSRFTDKFKKLFGLTPSDLRKTKE